MTLNPAPIPSASSFRETSSTTSRADDGSDTVAHLRTAALAFESMFLAEMLSHAGLGEVSDSFGGGPGEEAFASLLIREQARMMAERGGIGLAEQVFKALLAREDKT